MSDSAPSPGFFASLRQLGSTLAGIAGNRLELLLVELQEERNRLIAAVTLLSVCLLFAGFALALTTAAVVYLLWPTHPLAALLGVAGVYAIAAASAGRRCQALLQDSQPFASTLAEFRKDQQCLKPDAPTPSNSANNSSSLKVN